MKLKIGLPKGSLQESTFKLFKNAGYTIKLRERSYVPVIDDNEMEGLVIRAQEMARYVEDGALDAGLTGHDWIVETGANVREVAELVFSKVSRRPVRWVLCVPEDSPIKKVQDLHLDGQFVGDYIGGTAGHESRMLGFLPGSEEEKMAPWMGASSRTSTGKPSAVAAGGGPPGRFSARPGSVKAAPVAWAYSRATPRTAKQ